MQATTTRTRAGLWPLTLALGFAACGGDGSTEPTDGSIAVAISTTGTNLDPDGYSVALPGDPLQPVGVNGVLTISNVAAGDWSVPLYGVAANCAVAGLNPVAVTVTNGATAEVEFAVVCGDPPPPLLGRIAFETNRFGNIEVSSMNADGSDVVNLSEHPAVDLEPDWSPDGSMIAFVSDRDGNDEIYMMNADGSGQTRLTDAPGSDRNPEWSADGTRIAFDTDRDGNEEVYVMDADGSDQANLTNHPARDIHPAWSHDGTRIAFQTNRDGGGGSEVYLMNPDGSDPVNITNDPALDDGRPAWSPDDERIAFISDRDGNFEIYVMNADGSAKVRRTTDPEFDAFPEWSPDGEYIAFRSDRAGNLEIFVMAADGSGQFNRTNHPGGDCHPTWTSGAAASVRSAAKLRAPPAPGKASPRAPALLSGRRASESACLGH